MAEGEQVAQRVPSYARPNISSRLPGNIGLDHEQIKAAFAPGSYTSISGLSDHRTAAGSDASTHVSSTDPGVAFRAGSGVKRQFSEFHYHTSPYELLQDASTRERRDHQKCVESLHGDQQFVTPGSAHLCKFEGMQEYQSDPYDTARDEQLRSRWIEEKKVLAGTFMPPGRDKGLSKPSRAMLTDIMTHLYKHLYEDWEAAKPAVFTTSEDLIVVYFSLDSLKNDTGLVAYMNVLARRSPLVQGYELQKANEGWNVQTEDNHVMFTFRPPWVRERKFTNFKPAPPSAPAS
eukprot:Hpha_TRINITY_DN5396_c0_g1::TRINITY_DN5396_c0_g1_i1::g.32874::m.32874